MAINGGNPEKTLRAAIAKAQATKPVLLEVGAGWYVAASKSRPGHGHLLREHGGKVNCGCEGFERGGLCYHAAALALALELIPPRFLVDQAPADTRLDAPLVEAQKGKASLWT